VASLPHFELHILVGRREGVPGDDADARFLHSGSHTAQPGNHPDRREHHLFVDELLDTVEDRLPPLRIELDRLFLEEPVDVG
jgi:hypothetical protein